MSAYFTQHVNSTILLNKPTSFQGDGVSSIMRVGAHFPTTHPLFQVSPDVGIESRNWLISNFNIYTISLPSSVFLLSIPTAGQHLNKLTISNVIADAVDDFFVQLYNPINVDGLFSSVFADNWSLNGYYMDNIGDSVHFLRNTTSGTGRAYYINQLDGAASILIADGNSTSPGGVLIAHAMNLTFRNMQNECSSAYTGSGAGLITLQNGGGSVIINTRIIENNINTHGATNTTLQCVHVGNAIHTVIEGNTLACNATTGYHIVVAATSTGTRIGHNLYLNQGGAEIAARISDSGAGTVYTD